MATHEPSPEAERSVSIPEPEIFRNSSSSTSEPEIHVEPMPEWTEAIKSWGFAWDVHLYGLGAVFLLTAFLSLACFLRLVADKHRSSQRKVSVVLLGFLAVYGASRGVFLVIDAYHHKNTLPIPIFNVIWGIAQPCLMTSYTLLFVVLLNALRLKRRFQAWFTARNIAIVTVPHFLVVFGAELIVSFSPQFKTSIFFCQLLYALFSLTLALLYSYASIVIHKSVRKTKNNTVSELSSRTRINRLLYTCIVAAKGGFLVGITQVYIIAGPFGVFSSKTYVSPWPWYWVTTVMRLLEICMVMILFSIVYHQSSTGLNVRTVKVAAAEQKDSKKRFATEKI